MHYSFKAPSFLIVILMLLSMAGMGQNSRTDVKTLLSLERRDTTWVKWTTGSSLRTFRPKGPYDSLVYMGDLILAESEKLDFDWGRFFGNYLKGRAVFNLSSDSAFYYDQLGLSKVSTEKEAIKTLFLKRLSSDYYRAREFKKAKYFANALIENASKFGDQRNMAIGYSHLGIYLNRESNYVEAVSALISAIETAQEIGDLSIEVSASINLGNTYDDLKEYDKALKYFKSALEADKKLATKRGKTYESLPTLSNNIGRVMAKMGQYKEGKSFVLEALKKHPIPQRPGEIMYPLYNMGNIHLNQGNLDSADYYLSQSLKIANQYKDDYVIALTNHDLGQLHDQLNKQIEAEKHYLRAYEAALLRNYTNNEFINAAYRLYEINAEKGNQGEAVKYLQDWGVAKDSLYNLETNKQMALLEMEFNFESEKQALLAASEREQLVLENELQRKTIFQYALVAVALFILLIALNFYRSNQRRKKANEIIQKQNADLSASANQIRQLSSFKEGMIGMIAHDMKNSLNTILSLSKKGEQLDNRQAGRIHVAGNGILNLVSNMLDVQKFEEAKVNLNKERSHVSSIIDRTRESMEPLLQSKSMVMKHEVNGILSLSLDPEIINRVLINLVSNSVKYAPTGSYVLFEVTHEQRENGDFAILSITDQGTGVDEKFLPQLFDKFTQSDAKSLGSTGSSGLGLHFCKLAVEAHGGEIWAESPAETGLKISFSMPVEPIDLDQQGNARSKGQTEHDSKEAAYAFNPQDLEQMSPFIEKLKGFKVYQIKQIKAVIEEMKEAGMHGSWQDQLWKAALHGDQEQYDLLLSLSERDS